MPANTESTPGPLRLAFLLRTLNVGGAERQTLKLIQQFDPAEVKASVWVLVSEERQDLLPAFRTAGASVALSPFHRNDPRVLPWLIRQWRDHAINLVQSMLWRSDLTLALSGWMAPAPWKRVGSERGDRGHSVRRGLPWIDRHVIFPRLDAVISNSQWGAAQLRHHGCTPDKIHVIPNGVEPISADPQTVDAWRTRYAIPHEVPLIAWAARLEPSKDPLSFIEAARLITARALRPSPHFVMIGDGPMRSIVEKSIAEAGLSEVFHLTGRLGDPAPAYAAATLGVLTSVPEGTAESCPNVLLEFMAAGRAVVAPRIAGIPELLKDRVEGRLIPPQDPHALAGALVSLLEQPEALPGMGEAARRRVQQTHALADMAKRYVTLYRDLVRS